MQRVKKFSDFIQESNEFKKEIQQTISMKIWEGIFYSSYLTEQEKTWLKNCIKTENIQNEYLSESLLDTIKKGIRSLKDSDIGKSVIDKLSTLVQNAKSFSIYLSDLLKKSYDKILGYFVKKFDSPKKVFIEGIKKDKTKIKTLAKNIRHEQKLLTETISFWLKDIPKILYDSIRGIYSKEIIKECMEYNGDFIFELSKFNLLYESEEQKGIYAFLNKITHKLEKIPPFNLLKKIQDIGESGSNLFLTKFSELTKKLGGPGVYEFVAISSIAGFFFEYYVKNLALSGVDEILGKEIILRFIPMASSIVHSLMFTALIISILDTIRSIYELEHDLEKTK